MDPLPREEEDEEDLPWFERSIGPETEEIGGQCLDIEIIIAGDGFNYPQAGQRVSVEYVGYLPNGKVFDATYRRGQPLTFTLGQEQVIEGLDSAISQLSAGERAKIRIGHRRAYGAKGFPFLVPPSTGLIFDLQLLKY